ncbi:uncharacterized protein J3R85_017126 [Psidium guajava]|nr:uncharacterized protein J3R85_017126 [Psidium guajava]
MQPWPLEHNAAVSVKKQIKRCSHGRSSSRTSRWPWPLELQAHMSAMAAEVLSHEARGSHGH